MSHLWPQIQNWFVSQSRKCLPISGQLAKDSPHKIRRHEKERGDRLREQRGDSDFGWASKGSTVMEETGQRVQDEVRWKRTVGREDTGKQKGVSDVAMPGSNWLPLGRGPDCWAATFLSSPADFFLGREVFFSDPGIGDLVKIGCELAEKGAMAVPARRSQGVTIARSFTEAGSPRVQGRGGATELINGTGGPRHNNIIRRLAHALMDSA